MFSWKHMLIPIAIVHYITIVSVLEQKTFQCLYVFGIRIAYWTTTR